MADTISKKYKELSCYKYMSQDDQGKFDDLAKHYGTMLNKGPEQRVTVYTPHDFDHHCFNLYRNISLFILKEQGIQELKKEELYLLNLSVLLHDISMCRGGYEKDNPTFFNRKIHSQQSAQWIQHEYSIANSQLHISGLTRNQINFICNICQAHSDLKDRETPSGLFDPNLRNCETGEEGPVRTKALAGILRIADELDVTSQRLAGCNPEETLIHQPEDKRKEAQIFNEENQESIKHFRRLKLICGLELSSQNVEEIILKIDDQEINSRLEQGDEVNLSDDLRKIHEKIQKELTALWSEVLCKPDVRGERLTTLKRVVWSGEDTKWVERFSLEASPNTFTLPHKEKTLPSSGEGNSDTRDNSTKGAAIIIDSSLSEDIQKLVFDEGLLDVGHYQLNSVYCARDWIDTKELLTHSPLSNTIINTFCSHIKTSFCKEKYTIVGLDLMGATTAAQIGFILQKPFTYVIPAHQYSQADPHEVYVPGIPKDHMIVLVTDSIVTGHTVSKIIQENKWENRVLAIYTVFCRKPKAAQDIESIQFPCAIYALNAHFPAEIALVSHCPFGNYPENCRAKNKKL